MSEERTKGGVSKKLLAIGLMAVVIISLIINYGISSAIIKEGPAGPQGPMGPQGPKGESRTVVDWEEPPPLTKDIETAQDVVDDLDSLGCVLIGGFPGVHLDQESDDVVEIRTYREFRRVAFNTKIVFYSAYEGQPIQDMHPFTILEGCYLKLDVI